ncbi:MAG: EAL domain-containing protein [Pseudomonadota bacterium]
MGPLLLFQAWPHSTVLRGELDEVHERHLLLARSLAAALERYHRDLVTTFELLSTGESDWSNSDANHAVLENLDFIHMCLADWNTAKVVAAIAPVAAPCPSMVPEETLERLKKIASQDEVNFGSVVEGRTGDPTIHMVMRQGDNLVIGAITTAYFRKLGEAISFGVKGHAAIVDHTGQALSHPRPDWVAARKDMSKISAVQRMLKRETGVEIFYSPALDADMVAGFTFVDPVGWGVMIPQPISELYQRAEEAQRSSMVVLLVGTCLALICAITVSMRVVRPLERVSKASALIANGDLDFQEEPTPSRFLPKELSELQMRFREMVGRLRENTKTINALAYVDSVTGLGNRAVMQECLDHATQRGIRGAFLLLDLDGFKEINDTYGHDAGDEALAKVGRRICKALGIAPLGNQELKSMGSLGKFDGSHTQVSRIGGDEFAVWLPETNYAAAKSISDSILEAIRGETTLEGVALKLGASIGVAQTPEDATNRRELVKAADLALYNAKRKGKNRQAKFTPALKQAQIERQMLIREIEDGLKQGEFVPYFQPQFSLPDRNVTGVEALVRWNHATRGCLAPDTFLHVARDIGLLRDIDEAVQAQSIEMMTEVSTSDVAIKSLAVNVSEEHLGSPDFLENLARIPELPFELRFELIETMTLDRLEGRLAWTIDRIREFGFKLDLDDFGLSKASIINLMNIDPAHLKIDRHLIASITESGSAKRLVGSIIEMSHSLDVPIIAEGAEDEETVACLENLGCDYVQGFALAPPMPKEQLREFLQNYKRRKDTA